MNTFPKYNQQRAKSAPAATLVNQQNACAAPLFSLAAFNPYNRQAMSVPPPPGVATIQQAMSSFPLLADVDHHQKAMPVPIGE